MEAVLCPPLQGRYSVLAGQLYYRLYMAVPYWPEPVLSRRGAALCPLLRGLCSALALLVYIYSRSTLVLAGHGPTARRRGAALCPFPSSSLLGTCRAAFYSRSTLARTGNIPAGSGSVPSPQKSLLNTCLTALYSRSTLARAGRVPAGSGSLPSPLRSLLGICRAALYSRCTLAQAGHLPARSGSLPSPPSLRVRGRCSEFSGQAGAAL